MASYTRNSTINKYCNNRFTSIRWSGAVYLMVFCLSFITSCTTSRRVLKEPLKEHGSEFLISEMKANEVNFSYLSARFTAEITQGRNSNILNGQVRIKKDSIIWITLSPALGIEMGRLILTNDSVKWINRLENTFMLSTINKLSAVIHPAFKYELAQAFFLGNDLAMYDDSQFRATIDNKEYHLSVTNRRAKKLTKNQELTIIPVQHIWLQPQTYRITRVLIQDLLADGPQVEVRYKDFIRLNEFLFATNQQYFIQNASNKIRLNISLSKVESFPNLSFPFNIPAKYTPVNAF